MEYEEFPEKTAFGSHGKEAWRGDYDGAMRNQWHLSGAASFNMGVGGQGKDR